MTDTIDYYFSMASPWAYIGHARFMDIVRANGLKVRLSRSAKYSPKQAAFRSPNARQRGSATGFSICSAGVRSVA